MSPLICVIDVVDELEVLPPGYSLSVIMVSFLNSDPPEEYMVVMFVTVVDPVCVTVVVVLEVGTAALPLSLPPFVPSASPVAIDSPDETVVVASESTTVVATDHATVHEV